VEHVGIGNQDVGPLPDLPPLGTGGVAIVGLNRKREGAFIEECGRFGNLVMGQGFCWEKIQSTVSRLSQETLDNWYGVAKGFAGGCCGGNDHIFTSKGRFDSLDLMGIEAADAPAV
jgi:hypothetical protein